MQARVRDGDRAVLEGSARACARLVAVGAGKAPTGGRLVRALAFLLQALAVGARRVLREHWDIGVFDVAFGSVKAFGVYPALFRSGLAWTIPLLEYAPLNTQLWTAGYLGLRRRLRSKWGQWQHGVALETLDARRATALGVPVGAFLHEFEWEGRSFELRVVSGRLRAWWDRVRGRQPTPGTLHLGELRSFLPSRLVVAARGLRVHDLLYERTLIECVLRDPSRANALVARARVVPEARELPFGGLVSASRGATRTRIRQRADRHATRVRKGFAWMSRDGLALRWLGAAYQRRALRAVSRIEELEYALLADVHRGVDWEASSHAAPLASACEDLGRCCEALESFARRSRRAHAGGEARRIVSREIELARHHGLRVRRARAALLPGRLGALGVA